MIRQQINLYQERFHEPQVVLSALHAMVLLVLVLALVFAGSYQYDRKLSQQQAANAELVERKALADRQLAKNRARLDAELADTRIESRLRELLRDIDSRKRLIRFVENNSLGSGQGFSAQLRELSELGFDNVWLSEISLADNFVRLAGSALKERDIPLYFETFRQRKLFSGRAFDIFELKREQNQDWKVDFVIASRPRVDE